MKFVIGKTRSIRRLRVLLYVLLPFAMGTAWGANPLALPQYANQTKGIYGDDDRIDLYQARSTARKAAAATVALVEDGQLEYLASGNRYRLKQRTTGSQLGWCSEEPFADQPMVIPMCTGFLLGPTRVATAGHCVKPPSSKGTRCEDLRLVFDYQVPSRGRTTIELPEDSVYRCKEVLDVALDPRSSSDKRDWAVIELDRSVIGRSPVRVRQQGEVSSETRLTVMGYPSGLPLKIADGGQIKRNSHPVYFTTNLDTYGGNSGSPVFSTDSILEGDPMVEGILVRGATDYTQDAGRGCTVNYRCDEFGGRGCRGEDVTRISNVASWARGDAPAEDDSGLEDNRGSRHEDYCNALPGLCD